MASVKSQEAGPIVAIAMIVVGLSVVIWAVATKERSPVEPPQVNFNATLPGDEAETPEEPAGPVSDSEWEQVLIDVEQIKTEGLVKDVDVSAQVVTVSREKWEALEEARQQEIGRRLAVYCGRVSGSDDLRAELKDEEGQALGKYTWD